MSACCQTKSACTSGGTPGARWMDGASATSRSKETVCVRQRVQSTLPHEAESSTKGWVAGKVSENRHRADEETDDGFDFGALTIVRRCADHEASLLTPDG